MIPGVSISYQTALETSILRFPAHLILGRYKLYDHITTTHTAAVIQYAVDNSNNDVVIYWTMTGIHVVPDRQQYIGTRQVHTLYRIDNSMIGTH